MVGIPSYKSVIQEQHAKNKTNQLYSLLQHARSLAINSRGYVTICPSSTNIMCSNNWKDPLIVFLDHNKNEKVENQEQISNIHEMIDTQEEELSLKAAAGRKYIQFNQHGLINSTNGRLNFCYKDSDYHQYNRSLIISLSGRVRIETFETENKVIVC
jgi:type IV fimbrial biogenesis protein FimT